MDGQSYSPMVCKGNARLRSRSLCIAVTFTDVIMLDLCYVFLKQEWKNGRSCDCRFEISASSDETSYRNYVLLDLTDSNRFTDYLRQVH